MSKILDTIEKRQLLSEKCFPPSEYQQRIDLLRALDILADIFERIAVAQEIVAGIKRE